MMPQLVTYRQRRRDGRWLRLHVPVIPVVLLLSPLLLIVVLAGLVACLVFRISPVGALRGAGRCCARCPAPGSRSTTARRPCW
ncbi:hypothetical protein F4553_000395 [Allocatelliglobosispora scoriae]|uniref:Uncharacterized protein n=1 Tax=Allocatelliglobosispora scoriae TaxID=643052 RepID=A0A841BIK0_9ACTN|nr:hypothetical protein [Allocatelliglobosispora scoriae]MBB5867016.1 hypothetical protein [Allocatelliglobosispora scoriae]